MSSIQELNSQLLEIINTDNYNTTVYDEVSCVFFNLLNTITHGFEIFWEEKLLISYIVVSILFKPILDYYCCHYRNDSYSLEIFRYRNPDKLFQREESRNLTSQNNTTYPISPQIIET